MKLNRIIFLAQAFYAGIAITQKISETSTNVDSATPNSALQTIKTDYCEGNSANDRGTWCGHNISTDYHTVIPNGTIREYWLNISSAIICPLGRQINVTAVNESVPGPTLFANWGDEVHIHVTNNLGKWSNDTQTLAAVSAETPAAVSIHWHGIRQLGSPMYDGVPSITQCPIPYPQTFTYKWRATQYGTSWYHSHIGLQAWQGLFGGKIINGPATHNYDEDLGILFLNDWDNRTMHDLYDYAQNLGPVTMDTGLLNGTNEYLGMGHRFSKNVTEGKSYRLRIVNAAVETMFKFMIDSHNLTVIAMDLVPIHPIPDKSHISISMGTFSATPHLPFIFCSYNYTDITYIQDNATM